MCETDVQLTFHFEVLNGVNVLHVRNVCPALKHLGALTPLVYHRPLAAAGEDQVGFARDVQILHICVTVPRV